MGFEPIFTESESIVLPAKRTTLRYSKLVKLVISVNILFIYYKYVLSQGFEPQLFESKSNVLPLHQKSMVATLFYPTYKWPLAVPKKEFSIFDEGVLIQPTLYHTG